MRARTPRAPSALLNNSSRSLQQTPICSRCLQQYLPSSYSPIQASYYHPARRRNQSAWAQAVSAAQNFVSHAIPHDNAPPGVSVDPLRVVGKELKFLTNNIRSLLGSSHPILDTVAKYYTQSEGKHIRPLLVLLMSRATSLTPKTPRESSKPSETQVDESITDPGVLNDANPDQQKMHPLTARGTEYDYNIPDDPTILPSQRRLAEITELIHTASLLHDDVIDNSIVRRSEPSANIQFGNKMAVLAGDFLLGRASVALARLRDAEVVELLATVIANLVEGEFMQLKNTALDERRPVWTEDTVSYYLQKTYLKSASLISKSCRAAALLGQCTPEIVEAAYLYGRNLGLAFQLIDDMLDYTVSADELGKPAGADLELGLATAPLLFAWKSHSELGVLVGRKFSADGDVQMAREIVSQSDGIEQTRALAQQYADKAIAAVKNFPDCEAKDGLIEMVIKAMNRRK